MPTSDQRRSDTPDGSQVARSWPGAGLQAALAAWFLAFGPSSPVIAAMLTTGKAKES
jgi:hypothetical protein